MRQNAFEKTWLGEMLIEQIADFESRMPGPLVVHIFLKLVIFMTKQKSSNALFNAKNVAESNVP